MSQERLKYYQSQFLCTGSQISIFNILQVFTRKNNFKNVHAVFISKCFSKAICSVSAIELHEKFAKNIFRGIC